MADAVDFLRYIYFPRNPDVQVFMSHTPRLIFVFFFCPLAMWHSRHVSLASLACMNSEMLDEFFSPSKRGRHNRLINNLKSRVQIYREREIYVAHPGKYHGYDPITYSRREDNVQVDLQARLSSRIQVSTEFSLRIKGKSRYRYIYITRRH